jgi:hypothetical protein
MRKLLLGLAVLPFLAGASVAGQPQPLTDQQMDKVAAGFDFQEIDVNNVGLTGVFVNKTPVEFVGPPFLSISGTSYPSGVQSFQLFAVFGPP